jgi:hypothetical protein
MARTKSSRRIRWAPSTCAQRTLLRCALATSLTACLFACEGDSSGPARPQGGGGANASPGAMGQAPGASAEEVRVIDDTMRAQDPDLFALASRYFPGTMPASAPARLVRLTRDQLDRTAQTLLPNQVPSPALTVLPRDPLQTNYEYAANLGFNPANFTPLNSWVRAIADKVQANPALIASCKVDDQACLRSAARGFAKRAFRGVGSDAQLARFESFFTSSVSAVGLAQASADLTDLVLTSPSFVFRDEVQTDAQGNLLPAQWAQSLTYALTDAPPEALGMGEQEVAGLPRAAERTQWIDRLVATPEARAKLERFFMAWLEIKELAEFTIASEVFPEFTTKLSAAMLEETRVFLKQALGTPTPRLRDVTQAESSPVPPELASVYGLKNVVPGKPSQLDPTQRLGILTQPAVIASHSGPSTTRLVKRGVFFTRKMMCLPLGNPPPGVDTTLANAQGDTERERIESVTAKPSCAGCHDSINPFGFMQENYDPIGRWRTRDEGHPINSSIRLNLLDEGPLDTSSPVTALRAITSSARFQQCFVRQLFRFYMGRDETSGDDPVLRQMFFTLRKDDAQDLLAVLRTLASSPVVSARERRP